MKYITLWLLVFSFQGICQQKLHVPPNGCKFDLIEMPGNIDIDIKDADYTVQQIWNELLTVSGINNVNALIKQSTSRRFESFINDGHAWVIYNPEILHRYSTYSDYKWIVAFILAHELGHVALQHNISNGSNKTWEQDADDWASQQLCKMHANTDQAKQAVLVFVPDGGYISGYPSKAERLESIGRYFKENNCYDNRFAEQLNNLSGIWSTHSGDKIIIKKIGDGYYSATITQLGNAHFKEGNFFDTKAKVGDRLFLLKKRTSTTNRMATFDAIVYYYGTDKSFHGNSYVNCDPINTATTIEVTYNSERNVIGINFNVPSGYIIYGTISHTCTLKYYGGENGREYFRKE